MRKFRARHKVCDFIVLDPCLLNITIQNRKQSPLLRLPRELRDMIYQHALVAPEPLDLCPHEPYVCDLAVQTAAEAHEVEVLDYIQKMERY